ncbi:hypothetical protein SFRURICE_009595, partial [Spodoptera frugiperda]
FACISVSKSKSKSKHLFQLILNKALLKRQIELSVSLSVSEARRSFQSVASNGEERARNSIVTLLKKNPKMGDHRENNNCNVSNDDVTLFQNTT